MGFQIGDTVTFYNSKDIRQGNSIVCYVELNNTYSLIRAFGSWSEDHLIPHRAVLLEKTIKSWESRHLYLHP